MPNYLTLYLLIHTEIRMFSQEATFQFDNSRKAPTIKTYLAHGTTVILVLFLGNRTMQLMYHLLKEVDFF